MAEHEYTVRLDAFHGPLDLLLFLCRRAEVDVVNIPITQITDQYLEFLEQCDQIDVEQAGEFLVMAATLMEIKSRVLVPPDPDAENGDGSDAASDDMLSQLQESDPRYELIQQLLAYKRVREASAVLERRRQDWLARYPAASHPVNSKAPPTAQPSSLDEPSEGHEDDPALPPPQETDLEDIGIWDLYEVFQRIIEAVDFSRLGDHLVEYDDTPLQLHQEDLLDQLNRSDDGIVSMRSAMKGRNRSEMIGLFLATLELVRQRLVSVKQDRIHEDIVLVLRPQSEDDNAEAEPDADAKPQDPGPGA
ncbi:MAG: hypothetical protein D8M59_02435 [Planctomycetes bacterium]|nr:hypothetical protein [Planctomycetota bacterium]NOG54423.1 segregation/condensation protein A [Planctomycetota bacterium]